MQATTVNVRVAVIGSILPALSVVLQIHPFSFWRRLHHVIASGSLFPPALMPKGSDRVSRLFSSVLVPRLLSYPFNGSPSHKIVLGKSRWACCCCHGNCMFFECGTSLNRRGLVGLPNWG